MGIVGSQTIKNTLITYVGFVIGAVNTLYMYVAFLGETYYGLTAFLLSTATILTPLMGFGVQNTLIKFYSGYISQQERSQFLLFVLLLPLLLALFLFIPLYFFYDTIAGMLSGENNLLYEYIWMIPTIGLFLAYFEIFYALAKVNLKSVFGNFLREIIFRLLSSIALIMVYIDIITLDGFIYLMLIICAVIALIMMIYSFKTESVLFKKIALPENIKPILTYTFYIILSSTIAALLLDADKFMISQYIEIENVAYYSVAVFIAMVISVPGKSMQQITYPLTAELINKGKKTELNALYKKTSLTLQAAGGFILILILINVEQIYLLLPEAYRGGTFVVFAIGLSKYIELCLGNNMAILFNSQYYKQVLFLGIAATAAIILLNILLIPVYGINGAAIATGMSFIFYSLLKLVFVYVKMKLFPFTKKSGLFLLASLFLFFAFYYWNFNFSPFFNIVLKSIIFSSFYTYTVFKMKLPAELNISAGSYLKRYFK